MIGETLADVNDARVEIENTRTALDAIASAVLSARTEPAVPGAFEDADAAQSGSDAPVDDSLHTLSSLTSLPSSPRVLAPSISQGTLPPPPVSRAPSPPTLTLPPPLLPLPRLNMAQVAAPIPWPLTHSRGAPHFANDAIGFDTFFDDVDELGRRASASENDRMLWACRYAGAESELWCLVAALSDPVGTFQQFRAQVRAYYPHLDAARRFTLHDLDRLVRRTQAFTDMDREEFGRYFRSFITIASFLHTHSIISDRE